MMYDDAFSIEAVAASDVHQMNVVAGVVPLMLKMVNDLSNRNLAHFHHKSVARIQAVWAFSNIFQFLDLFSITLILLLEPSNRAFMVLLGDCSSFHLTSFLHCTVTNGIRKLSCA